MPRKRILTWQPGTSDRPGRWKKIYRGKAYYFAGGRGKTDEAAYQAAVESWRQREQQIKAAAPKPHQGEYEREVATWQEVLTWSRQHGEQAMADTATDKLQALRRELAQSKPGPLTAGLTFDGYFDPEVRHPAYMRALRKIGTFLEGQRRELLDSKATAFSDSLPDVDLQYSNSASHPAGQVIIKPDPTFCFDPIDPLVIEQQVWLDRLQVSRQLATAEDKTIAAHIANFLETKTQDAEANGISLSRLFSLRLHLDRFADWIGGGTSVDRISSTSLVNYRVHLLKKVADGKFASTTASDRLGSVKSFVRWLWQTEAIEHLPRVLQPQTKLLEIGKSKKRYRRIRKLRLPSCYSRRRSGLGCSYC